MHPLLARFLVRFGLDEQVWLAPAAFGAILLVSFLSAWVFHKLIFRLVLYLSRWTPSDLDSRMMRAIHWPLTLGILVLGAYLAVTLALGVPRSISDKVFGFLGVVLGVAASVGVVSKGIDWYLDNLAARTQNVIDIKLIPLLRRGAVALVYGIGVIIIVDLLGFSISPLIAGLGLGGLAVALAIQPTLANLFAGTYVMTEGVISPGDYIELENGITGYVVEVGWRSTRIRNWKNNLVVVPNNKFAETIITNYQQPTSAVNVWFKCGVSYDSDLYRVETVCNEVMDEVIESSEHAVKEYGKYFGFDSFGDSNVIFWLFVQAKDRWGSFVVQTELMQKLHQRLKSEGITINYPMRTLQFPKEWGPEAMLSRSEARPASRVNGRSTLRRGRRRTARDLRMPHDARYSGGGERSGAGTG
jgi:small-conductance mechanosensitive channel